MDYYDNQRCAKLSTKQVNTILRKALMHGTKNATKATQ